jgi:hypothetical protein
MRARGGRSGRTYRELDELSRHGFTRKVPRGPAAIELCVELATAREHLGRFKAIVDERDERGGFHAPNVSTAYETSMNGPTPSRHAVPFE